MKMKNSWGWVWGGQGGCEEVKFCKVFVRIQFFSSFFFFGGGGSDQGGGKGVARFGVGG